MPSLDRRASRRANKSKHSTRRGSQSKSADNSRSEGERDLELLWGIATQYARCRRPFVPGAEIDADPLESLLESKYLLEQALKWRDANPTQATTSSSSQPYTLRSSFLKAFPEFFGALKELEPQLLEVLTETSSVQSASDVGLVSAFATPSATPQLKHPRHSSKSSKRKGRKKSGKRGKRRSTPTPKIPRCSDPFLTPTPKGGLDSGPAGAGDDLSGKTLESSSLARVASDISNTSGRSLDDEDDDNDDDDVDGSLNPVTKLLNDAVERRSLTALLLALKMLLQSSSDSPPPHSPVAADAADETRGFSLDASSAVLLQNLKVEDPRRLRQQFLPAALRGLFRSSDGRKQTSGVLSGHVQLAEDADSILASGKSAFGTCGIFGARLVNKADEGDCQLKGGGKWYYEVQIVSFGKNHFCQIGWGTEEASFNDSKSLGVGDDKDSWSFCGKRHLKYNAGQGTSSDGDKYGIFNGGGPYKVGDVVGCLLNLDEGTMEFSINGKRLGNAFSNLPKEICCGRRPIFPCVSVSANEKVSIRTGLGTLSHMPDGYRSVSSAANLHLLRLNGARLKVDGIPVSTFRSKFTIEFFASVGHLSSESDDPAGEQVLFGCGRATASSQSCQGGLPAFAVSVLPNGRIKVEGSQFVHACVSFRPVFISNDWTHVAIVSDGKDLTVFRNGSRFDTFQHVRTDTGSNARKPVGFGSHVPTSWIGGWPSLADGRGHTQKAFHGLLGEIRLWTVARSARDVRANSGCFKLDLSRSNKPVGLFANWRFCTGSGTRVYDMPNTLQPHHGIIVSVPFNNSDAQSDYEWVSYDRCDLSTQAPVNELQLDVGEAAGGTSGSFMNDVSVLSPVLENGSSPDADRTNVGDIEASSPHLAEEVADPILPRSHENLADASAISQSHGFDAPEPESGIQIRERVRESQDQAVDFGAVVNGANYAELDEMALLELAIAASLADGPPDANGEPESENASGAPSADANEGLDVSARQQFGANVPRDDSEPIVEIHSESDDEDADLELALAASMQDEQIDAAADQSALSDEQAQAAFEAGAAEDEELAWALAASLREQDDEPAAADSSTSATVTTATDENVGADVVSGGLSPHAAFTTPGRALAAQSSGGSKETPVAIQDCSNDRSVSGNALQSRPAPRMQIAQLFSFQGVQAISAACGPILEQYLAAFRKAGPLHGYQQIVLDFPFSNLSHEHLLEQGLIKSLLLQVFAELKAAAPVTLGRMDTMVFLLQLLHALALGSLSKKPSKSLSLPPASSVSKAQTSLDLVCLLLQIQVWCQATLASTSTGISLEFVKATQRMLDIAADITATCYEYFVPAAVEHQLDHISQLIRFAPKNIGVTTPPTMSSLLSTLVAKRCRLLEHAANELVRSGGSHAHPPALAVPTKDTVWGLPTKASIEPTSADGVPERRNSFLRSIPSCLDFALSQINGTMSHDAEQATLDHVALSSVSLLCRSLLRVVFNFDYHNHDGELQMSQKPPLSVLESTHTKCFRSSQSCDGATANFIRGAGSPLNRTPISPGWSLPVGKNGKEQKVSSDLASIAPSVAFDSYLSFNAIEPGTGVHVCSTRVPFVANDTIFICLVDQLDVDGPESANATERRQVWMLRGSEATHFNNNGMQIDLKRSGDSQRFVQTGDIIVCDLDSESMSVSCTVLRERAQSVESSTKGTVCLKTVHNLGTIFSEVRGTFQLEILSSADTAVGDTHSDSSHVPPPASPHSLAGTFTSLDISSFMPHRPLDITKKQVLNVGSMGRDVIVEVANKVSTFFENLVQSMHNLAAKSSRSESVVNISSTASFQVLTTVAEEILHPLVAMLTLHARQGFPVDMSLLLLRSFAIPLLRELRRLVALLHRLSSSKPNVVSRTAMAGGYFNILLDSSVQLLNTLMCIRESTLGPDAFHSLPDDPEFQNAIADCEWSSKVEQHVLDLFMIHRKDTDGFIQSPTLNWLVQDATKADVGHLAHMNLADADSHLVSNLSSFEFAAFVEQDARKTFVLRLMDDAQYFGAGLGRQCARLAVRHLTRRGGCPVQSDSSEATNNPYEHFDFGLPDEYFNDLVRVGALALRRVAALLILHAHVDAFSAENVQNSGAVPPTVEEIFAYSSRLLLENMRSVSGMKYCNALMHRIATFADAPATDGSESRGGTSKEPTAIKERLRSIDEQLDQGSPVTPIRSATEERFSNQWNSVPEAPPLPGVEPSEPKYRHAFMFECFQLLSACAGILVECNFEKRVQSNGVPEAESSTAKCSERTSAETERPLCPNGDPLMPFVTPKTSFSCDSCGAKQPMCAPMLSCRRCDFDICLACVSTTSDFDNSDDTRSISSDRSESSLECIIQDPVLAAKAEALRPIFKGTFDGSIEKHLTSFQLRADAMLSLRRYLCAKSLQRVMVDTAFSISMEAFITSLDQAGSHHDLQDIERCVTSVLVAVQNVRTATHAGWPIREREKVFVQQALVQLIRVVDGEHPALSKAAFESSLYFDNTCADRRLLNVVVLALRAIEAVLPLSDYTSSAGFVSTLVSASYRLAMRIVNVVQPSVDGSADVRARDARDAVSSRMDVRVIHICHRLCWVQALCVQSAIEAKCFDVAVASLRASVQICTSLRQCSVDILPFTAAHDRETPRFSFAEVRQARGPPLVLALSATPTSPFAQLQGVVDYFLQELYQMLRYLSKRELQSLAGLESNHPGANVVHEICIHCIRSSGCASLPVFLRTAALQLVRRLLRWVTPSSMDASTNGSGNQRDTFAFRLLSRMQIPTSALGGSFFFSHGAIASLDSQSVVGWLMDMAGLGCAGPFSRLAFQTLASLATLLLRQMLHVPSLAAWKPLVPSHAAKMVHTFSEFCRLRSSPAETVRAADEPSELPAALEPPGGFVPEAFLPTVRLQTVCEVFGGHWQLPQVGSLYRVNGKKCRIVARNPSKNTVSIVRMSNTWSRGSDFGTAGKPQSVPCTKLRPLICGHHMQRVLATASSEVFPALSNALSSACELLDEWFDATRLPALATLRTAEGLPLRITLIAKPSASTGSKSVTCDHCGATSSTTGYCCSCTKSFRCLKCACTVKRGSNVYRYSTMEGMFVGPTTVESEHPTSSDTHSVSRNWLCLRIAALQPSILKAMLQLYLQTSGKVERHTLVEQCKLLPKLADTVSLFFPQDSEFSAWLVEASTNYNSDPLACQEVLLSHVLGASHWSRVGSTSTAPSDDHRETSPEASDTDTTASFANADKLIGSLRNASNFVEWGNLWTFAPLNDIFGLKKTRLTKPIPSISAHQSAVDNAAAAALSTAVAVNPPGVGLSAPLPFNEPGDQQAAARDMLHGLHPDTFAIATAQTLAQVAVGMAQRLMMECVADILTTKNTQLDPSSVRDKAGKLLDLLAVPGKGRSSPRTSLRNRLKVLLMVRLPAMTNTLVPVRKLVSDSFTQLLSFGMANKHNTDTIAELLDSMLCIVGAELGQALLFRGTGSGGASDTHPVASRDIFRALSSYRQSNKFHTGVWLNTILLDVLVEGTSQSTFLPSDAAVSALRNALLLWVYMLGSPVDKVVRIGLQTLSSAFDTLMLAVLKPQHERKVTTSPNQSWRPGIETLIQEIMKAIPLNRLRNLAASLQDLEMEDAPIHSGFLKALCEFLAVVQVLEKVFPCKKVPCPSFGCLRFDPSDTVPRGALLQDDIRKNADFFRCLCVYGRDLRASWTSEFWLRRERDPSERPIDSGPRMEVLAMSSKFAFVLVWPPCRGTTAAPENTSTRAGAESPQQRLDRFLAGSENELDFPKGQTSAERQAIHTLAGKMGLLSASSGTGEARFLTVRRPPASPFALGSGSGPYFALLLRSSHKLIPFVVKPRLPADKEGDDTKHQKTSMLCSRGHDMQQLNAEARWLCRRCNRMGRGGQKRWDCRECSSSLCVDCALSLPSLMKQDVVVERDARDDAGFSVIKADLRVSRIRKNCPAFHNGLRVQHRVIAVDGQSVSTFEEYREVAYSRKRFVVTTLVESAPSASTVELDGPRVMAPDPGQWAHIAVLAQDSDDTFKLFVDGVDVGQAVSSEFMWPMHCVGLMPSARSNAAPVVWAHTRLEPIDEGSGWSAIHPDDGRRYSFSARSFVGCIGEIRVWNVARHPNAILKARSGDLRTGPTYPPQGLLGHWVFDGSTSCMIGDQTNHFPRCYLVGLRGEGIHTPTDGVATVLPLPMLQNLRTKESAATHQQASSIAVVGVPGQQVSFSGRWVCYTLTQLQQYVASIEPVVIQVSESSLESTAAKIEGRVEWPALATSVFFVGQIAPRNGQGIPTSYASPKAWEALSESSAGEKIFDCRVVSFDHGSDSSQSWMLHAHFSLTFRQDGNDIPAATAMQRMHTVMGAWTTRRQNEVDGKFHANMPPPMRFATIANTRHTECMVNSHITTDGLDAGTLISASPAIGAPCSALVDLCISTSTVPFIGFIKSSDTAVPMKARGQLRVLRDGWGNLIVDGFYQTLKSNDSWWEPNGIIGRTADFPPAPRWDSVDFHRTHTHERQNKIVFMCTHTPHKWEKISRLSGAICAPHHPRTLNSHGAVNEQLPESGDVQIPVAEGVLSFPRYVNVVGTNAENHFRDWHLFFDDTVDAHAGSRAGSHPIKSGRAFWEFEVVQCRTPSMAIGVCGLDAATVIAETNNPGDPAIAQRTQKVQHRQTNVGWGSLGQAQRSQRSPTTSQRRSTAPSSLGAGCWFTTSGGEVWAHGRRCSKFCSTTGPRDGGDEERGFANWRAGDVVGVELDMDKGTVQYHLNGRCLGSTTYGLRPVDGPRSFGSDYNWETTTRFHDTASSRRGGMAHRSHESADGVFPFVTVAQSGDQVRLLGLKSGISQTVYNEFDQQSRVSFVGMYHRGARRGFGFEFAAAANRCRWECRVGSWCEDLLHGIVLCLTLPADVGVEGDEDEQRPLGWEDVSISFAVYAKGVRQRIALADEVRSSPRWVWFSEIDSGSRNLNKDQLLLVIDRMLAGQSLHFIAEDQLWFLGPSGAPELRIGAPVAQLFRHRQHFLCALRSLPHVDAEGFIDIPGDGSEGSRKMFIGRYVGAESTAAAAQSATIQLPRILDDGWRVQFTAAETCTLPTFAVAQTPLSAGVHEWSVQVLRSGHTATTLGVYMTKASRTRCPVLGRLGIGVAAGDAFNAEELSPTQPEFWGLENCGDLVTPATISVPPCRTKAFKVVTERDAAGSAGFAVMMHTLVVTSMTEDCGAFKNGLRDGDRIVAVDGTRVKTFDEYRECAYENPKFVLTVLREEPALNGSSDPSPLSLSTDLYFYDGDSIRCRLDVDNRTLSLAVARHGDILSTEWSHFHLGSKGSCFRPAIFFSAASLPDEALSTDRADTVWADVAWSFKYEYPAYAHVSSSRTCSSISRRSTTNVANLDGVHHQSVVVGGGAGTADGWDGTRMGAALTASDGNYFLNMDEGRIAKRQLVKALGCHGHGTAAVVACTPRCPTAAGTSVQQRVYRWAFCVNHGSSLFIGLMRGDLNVNSCPFVGGVWGTWSYSQKHGKVCCQGEDEDLYGQSYEPGDRIDVEVDIVARTLRFYKNLVDQGVAAENLPVHQAELHAAVTLVDAADSVTLLFEPAIAHNDAINSSAKSSSSTASATGGDSKDNASQCTTISAAPRPWMRSTTHGVPFVYSVFSGEPRWHQPLSSVALKNMRNAVPCRPVIQDRGYLYNFWDQPKPAEPQTGSPTDKESPTDKKHEAVQPAYACVVCLPGVNGSRYIASAVNGPGLVALNWASPPSSLSEPKYFLSEILEQGPVAATLANSDDEAASPLPAFASITRGPCGILFCANKHRHLIQYVDPDTHLLHDLAGLAGTEGYRDGDGQHAMFKSPQGLSWVPYPSSCTHDFSDDIELLGVLFVCDTGNNVVRGVVVARSNVSKEKAALDSDRGGTRTDDPAGRFICAVFTAFGSKAHVNNRTSNSSASGRGDYADGLAADSRFSLPSDLVYSSEAGGTLYISDTGNNCIRKVAHVGRLMRTLRVTHQPSWHHQVGKYLFRDRNSDSSKHLKQKSVMGPPSSQRDSGGAAALQSWHAQVGQFLFKSVPTTPQQSSAASVANPLAEESMTLTVPALELLYVTTIAGNPLTSGCSDGCGCEALFQRPTALALVPSTGALLVVDSGNRKIRILETAFGCVATLPGPSTSQPACGEKRAESQPDEMHRILMRQAKAALSFKPKPGKSSNYYQAAGSTPCWKPKPSEAGSGDASAEGFSNPTHVCIDEDKGLILVLDHISDSSKSEKSTAASSTWDSWESQAQKESKPASDETVRSVIHCLMYDEKNLQKRMREIREMEERMVAEKKRAAKEAEELEKAREVAKAAERLEQAQNLAAFGMADLDTCVELLIAHRDNMQMAADAMLDPHRMRQIQHRVAEKRAQREAQEAAEAEARAAAEAREQNTAEHQVHAGSADEARMTEANSTASESVPGPASRSGKEAVISAAGANHDYEASNAGKKFWRLTPRVSDRWHNVRAEPSLKAPCVGRAVRSEVVRVEEVLEVAGSVWVRTGVSRWLLASRPGSNDSTRDQAKSGSVFLEPVQVASAPHVVPSNSQHSQDLHDLVLARWQDSMRLWTPRRLERQAADWVYRETLRIPTIVSRARAQLDVTSIAVPGRPEKGPSAHSEDCDPSQVTLFGEFAASMNHTFVLDPRSSVFSDVAVSEDLQTATGTSPRQGLVFGSRGFSHGRHYWEVLVSRAEAGKVFIGVSERLTSAPRHGWGRESRRLGGSGGGAGSLVGFVNYRCIVSSKGEHLYGKFYQPGDVIGVLLDMDRGTVAFTKQGSTEIGRSRLVFENHGIGPMCSHLRSGRDTHRIRFSTGVGAGAAKHRVYNSGAGLAGSSGIEGHTNRVLFPVLGFAHENDVVTTRFCNHWSSTDYVPSSQPVHPVPSVEEQSVGQCSSPTPASRKTHIQSRTHRAIDCLAAVYHSTLLAQAAQRARHRSSHPQTPSTPSARLLSTSDHSADVDGKFVTHDFIVSEAHQLLQRMSTPELRVVRTQTRDAVVIDLADRVGRPLFRVKSTMVPGGATAVKLVSVGDEFQTARGIARVLGVGYPQYRRFQIWYRIVAADDPQLDPGEQLAWYWTRSRFVHMLERGEIKPVRVQTPKLLPAVSTSIDGDVEHSDSKCQGPVLNFADFRRMATSFASVETGSRRPWFFREDTAIIEVVNIVSDRAGCDPAHLTVNDLLAGFRAVVKRNGESTITKSSSEAIAGAVCDSDSGPTRTSAALCPDSSFQRLLARAALLIAMGAQLEDALPLVDLHAQSLVRPAASEDNTGRAFAPLARVFRRCRGLIPLRNKATIFSRLLDVSTTPTTPGEDDWENPREMQELKLDRRAASDFDDILQDGSRTTDSIGGSKKPTSSPWDVRTKSSAAMPGNALCSQLHAMSIARTMSRCSKCGKRSARRKWVCRQCSLSYCPGCAPHSISKVGSHGSTRSDLFTVPSLYQRSLLVQLLSHVGGRRSNRVEVSSDATLSEILRVESPLTYTPFQPGDVSQPAGPSGDTLVINDSAALESVLWRRSYVHVLNGGQERAFFVKFVGEGVTDQGGPYRAVLNKIVAEESMLSDVSAAASTLRSTAQSRAQAIASGDQGTDDSDPSVLQDEQRASMLEGLVASQALLVPCPNATVAGAPNKDAVVFNPQLEDSTGTLALYHFLGKVMGLCIRHKIPLAMTLAPSMWKLLSQERMDLADLASVDTPSASAVSLAYQLASPGAVQTSVLDLCARYSAVNVDEMDDEDIADMLEDVSMALNTAMFHVNDSSAIFSVESEDGGASKLCESAPDTSSSSLSRSRVYSREQLCDVADAAKQWLLVQQHRLKAAALIAGLGRSIPAMLFPMFTAGELETLFCGASRLDVDLLEKVTVYGTGCSRSDAHVEFFWSALRDDTCFSDAQRAQFLHFCWARSRLPTSVDGFNMPFKISAATGSAAANPDEHLPTSQTCFFNLTLPRYSSREILVEKLKYAITNTRSMDADFRVSSDEP